MFDQGADGDAVAAPRLVAVPVDDAGLAGAGQVRGRPRAPTSDRGHGEGRADVHQPGRAPLDLVGQPGGGALALGHPVLEHEAHGRGARRASWSGSGPGSDPTNMVKPTSVSVGTSASIGGPQPEGGPVGQEHGEADGQRRGRARSRSGAGWAPPPAGRRATTLATEDAGRVGGRGGGQRQPGGVAEEQPAGQHHEAQRGGHRGQRPGAGRAVGPPPARRGWPPPTTISGHGVGRRR